MLNSSKPFSAVDFDTMASHELPITFTWSSAKCRKHFQQLTKIKTKNILLMPNLTPNNKGECSKKGFSMVMLCIQAFEKKVRVLGEENGGRMEAEKTI